MRLAPSPPANATPAAALDAQARRLLWRCRRGMKELDVMLEPGSLPRPEGQSGVATNTSIEASRAAE